MSLKGYQDPILRIYEGEEMSSSNRVSITAGDIEIELHGAAIEIDEKLSMMKERLVNLVILL